MLVALSVHCPSINRTEKVHAHIPAQNVFYCDRRQCGGVRAKGVRAKGWSSNPVQRSQRCRGLWILVTEPGAVVGRAAHNGGRNWTSDCILKRNGYVPALQERRSKKSCLGGKAIVASIKKIK
eukprot:scaffold234734_cov18-Tisochrysis_lutea.AAC.2